MSQDPVPVLCCRKTGLDCKRGFFKQTGVAVTMVVTVLSVVSLLLLLGTYELAWMTWQLSHS